MFATESRGDEQSQNGVGLDHRGEDHRLAELVGALCEQRDRGDGSSGLLLCGDQAHDCHRHAGREIEQAFSERDVGGAAQNADVRQREEGDQKAVDALRAREKLEDQHLAEQGGFSVRTPAAAWPAMPTPISGADAAEQSGEDGAGQCENDTERIEIKVFSILLFLRDFKIFCPCGKRRMLRPPPSKKLAEKIRQTASGFVYVCAEHVDAEVQRVPDHKGQNEYGCAERGRCRPSRPSG